MSSLRFAFLAFTLALACPTAAGAQAPLRVEGTITFGAPAAAPTPAPLLAPVAPTAPVVAAPTAQGAPVVPTLAPPAAPRMTRRWGLVGAGAGLALGSYALNVVGTLLWMAVPTGIASTDFLVPTWNGHREELLLWSFVPVAGPLAQIAYAEEDWQIPLFVAAAALELTGFVMAIVGTASRVAVAPREPRTASTVTVMPWASGTGGGLSAAGTF